MNTAAVTADALQTIRLEAEAVAQLSSFVNEDFTAAVRLIHEASGRVVVSGIGKSAIIAQKLVATFNSTGTPALFLHAADAIHGDLGMIQTGDVVLVISKSGESPEIKVLLPLLKNFGNPVIALCGAVHSYLATQADCLINTTVTQEACPNNLAPTTSTTAQLVMGDALAVCLLNLKGFTAQDFARYHPGGALGKKLYLRIKDMLPAASGPVVAANASVQQVIYEISSKRLGATAVSEAGQVIGIITDGDLRRMLEQHDSIKDIRAADILTRNPKTIDADALAVEALDLLRTHDITQLVVLDASGAYVGILHLHDLVREGIL
ncbi:MAG: KpsF/GutQ family sugar-phosphate isomerase [Sphingobacteriales bacterium]|nr:MAG: KpsF/GutQ family sugar-phosphate isomerase [Sphingobacteriales bacterium]